MDQNCIFIINSVKIKRHISMNVNEILNLKNKRKVKVGVKKRRMFVDRKKVDENYKE